MKIAVFDSTVFKFSRALIDHWASKGHEVRYEIGANPALAEWADVTFIDFLDNNFYCLFNGIKGDHEAPDWKPYPKKRIVVRGIDIDIWLGRHCDQRIWNYMDNFIVINQKLYDKVQREGNPPPGKMYLIKMGVDLDKFTFRTKKMDYNVCMVTGNFWEMKMVNEGYRIFDMLVRKYSQFPWKLHVRGEYNCREMEQVMKEHVIDSMGIRDRITVYPHVADMNAWLEPMDFILVPSYKEAFSYATAEAMAKGIKPILNNWWGSEDIWPKKYIYSHLDEAVEMFFGDYKPEEYRQVVEERYDVKRMFHEMDALLGL
jgi:glycosyltransferase involved in cell wall biosynthesis